MHGVSPAGVNELVAALNGLFDFRRARAGDRYRFTLRTADGRITKFRYETGPLDVWEVERGADDVLTARKLDIPVRTEIVEIGARVAGQPASGDEAGRRIPGPRRPTRRRLRLGPRFLQGPAARRYVPGSGGEGLLRRHAHPVRAPARGGIQQSEARDVSRLCLYAGGPARQTEARRPARHDGLLPRGRTEREEALSEDTAQVRPRLQQVRPQTEAPDSEVHAGPPRGRLCSEDGHAGLVDGRRRRAQGRLRTGLRQPRRRRPQERPAELLRAPPPVREGV
jgi:hypothetical protein